MFPNKKFVCSVCHVRVQSKESLEKHKESHKKISFKLKKGSFFIFKVHGSIKI